MSQPTPHQYRNLALEGGRLTALRELPFHDRELETACRDLLEAPVGELVIDLSGIGYLASTQIGALVAASQRAIERRRHLRIIVSPNLVKFLERLKVDGLIAYEVAGAPPPAED